MANTTELKTLPELVAEYGVQAATTGILAPTKELADALTAASAEAAQYTADDLLTIPKSELILADDYGEYGSTFYACRLCGKESGAGILNKGIEHEWNCPLHPDNIGQYRAAPQASQPIEQPVEHFWNAKGKPNHAAIDRYNASNSQPVSGAEMTDEARHTLTRAIDCLEILDKRPRPMCRDCADENGICPNGGLDCDMQKLIANARALLSASAQASQSEKAVRDAALADVLIELAKELPEPEEKCPRHWEAYRDSWGLRKFVVESCLDRVKALASTPAQQTEAEKGSTMFQEDLKRITTPAMAQILGMAHAQQTEAPVNVPSGWKLVPVNYTPEMRAAWDRAPQSEDDDRDFDGAYRAMLAAAPAPVQAEAQRSEKDAEHPAFKSHGAALIEVSRLNRELAEAKGALSKDAERYRYLRNEAWGCGKRGRKDVHVCQLGAGVLMSAVTELAEDALDEAIDSAIAAHQKEDKA